MPGDPLTEINVRLEDLRRQMDKILQQQESLAKALQELLGTFRSLALHAGIPTEAYRTQRDRTSASEGPPPGFA
jgi:hypothetical protein